MSVFGLLTCVDLQVLLNRCFCGPRLWLVQCGYKAVYLNNSACVCVCVKRVGLLGCSALRDDIIVH